MKRRRRRLWVELGVSGDGLGGRKYLHVDAAGAQHLERARVGSHPAMSPRADDEPPGQLVEDVGEVLEHEPVPVLPPPAAHDALREHDHVARLLAPVDRHVPEAVAVDRRHRPDRSAGVAAVSIGCMGREVELWRHTDADGDVLTAAGVAAALQLGARLRGGYHVAASSGAQRATQTLACFLAALGQEVPGGVVVELGLRSQVEERWRAAYQAAGSGGLEALREADPELVVQDSERLGAALGRVLDGLPEDGRAIAVGHSPTNEAAVLGLTGRIVAPLSKGCGVLVAVGDEGFLVEPLT